MKSRSEYPIIILIIFLLWLPVYLAYFPGVFSYDILVQAQMIMGTDPFTSQQPVLHTMFFKLCIGLGNLTGIKSIVIYSIAQMLVLAAFCAYIVNLFSEKSESRILPVLTIIFYALNPVISVFSFSTCKNILFGACFLMFILEVVRFSQGIYYAPRLFAFSLLGCLLLNNFIYVLVVFTVITVLFYKKKAKGFVTVLFCSAAAYLVISLAAYPAMGVGRNNSKEMLSVPLQQLVYARESGCMSPEDEASLLGFFDGSDYGYFQFGNADMIKTNFSESAYAEKKNLFWALYRNYLYKCPGKYAYAFIRLNFPLWSPIGFDLCDYTMTGYIETQSYDIRVPGYEGFERKSVFPGLFGIYERFTSYSLFRGHPVWEFIFGISLPFWVNIICMIWVILKRWYGKILPLIPSLLLTGTYLLGPLSNMRYVFPCILIIPLMIVHSFSKIDL